MSPTDNSVTSSLDQRFEMKCAYMVNNEIPVRKYVSIRTGLTVVVGEVEGPLVNGYFCIATEAKDDDGLPHALEHLIFLGSQQYPYKGVLDLLANRCYASGTNAWTDTDHTCYTMTTAGNEGFLILMPIYLDHILYPTLKESSFTTEVYHVNGSGCDGGVVFTEIQGVENTGERLLNRELMRALYPGDCGYKYQTGGIMHNLRTSTNNEKARAYHREFYRPENLYVIIVGNIKSDQVLERLQVFEDKIVAKGDRGAFKKPWQSPIPPFSESVEIDVPYPNDEEDNGILYIGWRGPSAATDLYTITACSILLKYLTDTTVSPLPKEFVDVPDPYASKVTYNLIENSESVITLNFENVPKEKLNSIKPKLDKIFNDILNSEQPIDMQRLSTVIHRHQMEILSHLENSPHESIAYLVIAHMLHGQEQSQDLDIRLNQDRVVKRLASEPRDFWITLLKEYFVNGPTVTAKGYPSRKRQAELAKEEEERITRKVEELGPDGLKIKEEDLLAAMAINEIPPPREMLRSVPILSTDMIHFHKISSTTSDSKYKDPRFYVDQVPLYMQLDNLSTNFAYIMIFLDSFDLSDDLRLYIPLFLELIQESPILRDGKLLSHEVVISELERDTVGISFKAGIDTNSRFQCGPFSSTLTLLLQVEPKKYERGINWVRELLYYTVFTPERIKVLTTKIVNNVSEVKRKGGAMTHDLMRGLLYSKGSNHYAVSALRQVKFLRNLLAKLEDNPHKIIEDLEQVRKNLTTPSNMVIHLSTNLDVLSTIYPNPASLWVDVLPQAITPVKNRLRSTFDWKLLHEKNVSESCVVGIGSIETAYFCQTIPGVADFTDDELPKLLVFFQYLTQLEGPLWRKLRGQGFVYSYSIVAKPNEAKLFLYFYKASNVVGAYREARGVIEERLKDNVVWEDTLFESAKSSLIYEVVHREKAIGDVVVQSLLCYFKGVSHDYNRELVKRISDVKVEDMLGIGAKYAAPLLDSNVTKTIVVCHPSKVKEIAKGLEALGLNLKTYSGIDETFLNEI